MLPRQWGNGLTTQPFNEGFDIPKFLYFVINGLGMRLRIGIEQI